ncbi:hypothetical protein Dimus_032049 [Dionaea muscipula]
MQEPGILRGVNAKDVKFNADESSRSGCISSSVHSHLFPLRILGNHLFQSSITMAQQLLRNFVPDFVALGYTLFFCFATMDWTFVAVLIMQLQLRSFGFLLRSAAGFVFHLLQFLKQLISMRGYEKSCSCFAYLICALGLGKDGSGMVEPVQVQVVESRAGLGSQQKRSGPNFEVHPGDSYKALIQKMALARFREMS